MPAGDRTGPMGMGPRSGRGAGYCGGFRMPGYANPAAGRGLGAGFGRGRGYAGRGFGGGGRGWRNWFYATGLPGWQRFGFRGYGPNPADEKQALEQEAEALRSELDSVRKRLSEIESKSR